MRYNQFVSLQRYGLLYEDKEITQALLLIENLHEIMYIYLSNGFAFLEMCIVKNAINMKNAVLKFILVAITILLLVYTWLAFKNEGINLFAIFFSNIQSLTWNGQFNLDFSSYLLLSGLWIMWRNKFTPISIVLGVVASIVGIVVFAPYLYYLIFKEKDDLVKVLIGERR